ncbi:hypothetical protein BH24ACT5_BH24ACT5_21280 [soil metagenome]
MPEPTNANRVAIELLILWLEPGDDARRHAAEHTVNVVLAGSTVEEQLAKAVVALSGVLNLSRSILLQLVKTEAAGVDVDDS